MLRVITVQNLIQFIIKIRLIKVLIKLKENEFKDKNKDGGENYDKNVQNIINQRKMVDM